MLARGELIGETSPTIAGSDVQEQVLGKKYQVSRRLLTLYSPQVPKKPLKRTDGRRTVHETPVGLLGSVYRHQTAMTQLSIQVEAKNILVRDPASGRSVTYRQISKQTSLGGSSILVRRDPSPEETAFLVKA